MLEPPQSLELAQSPSLRLSLLEPLLLLELTFPERLLDSVSLRSSFYYMGEREKLMVRHEDIGATIKIRHLTCACTVNYSTDDNDERTRIRSKHSPCRHDVGLPIAATVAMTRREINGLIISIQLTILSCLILLDDKFNILWQVLTSVNVV